MQLQEYKHKILHLFGIFLNFAPTSKRFSGLLENANAVTPPVTLRILHSVLPLPVLVLHVKEERGHSNSTDLTIILYDVEEKQQAIITMSQTTPAKSKQVVHTHAIDLARRWSVQNENDMMQASCSCPVEAN